MDFNDAISLIATQKEIYVARLNYCASGTTVRVKDMGNTQVQIHGLQVLASGRYGAASRAVAECLCAVCLCFPLWRAEQLDSMGGSRRRLFESHGRVRFVCPARPSSAVASSRQAAQEYPLNRGATPGAAFFCVLFLADQEKYVAAGLPPADFDAKDRLPDEKNARVAGVHPHDKVYCFFFLLSLTRSAAAIARRPAVPCGTVRPS